MFYPFMDPGLAGLKPPQYAHLLAVSTKNRAPLPNAFQFPADFFERGVSRETNEEANGDNAEKSSDRASYNLSGCHRHDCLIPASRHPV
jgi:hypothetical protein